MATQGGEVATRAKELEDRAWTSNFTAVRRTQRMPAMARGIFFVSISTYVCDIQAYPVTQSNYNPIQTIPNYVSCEVELPNK